MWKNLQRDDRHENRKPSCFMSWWGLSRISTFIYSWMCRYPSRKWILFAHSLFPLWKTWNSNGSPLFSWWHSMKNTNSNGSPLFSLSTKMSWKFKIVHEKSWNFKNFMQLQVKCWKLFGISRFFQAPILHGNLEISKFASEMLTFSLEFTPRSLEIQKIAWKILEISKCAWNLDFSSAWKFKIYMK